MNHLRRHQNPEKSLERDLLRLIMDVEKDGQSTSGELQREKKLKNPLMCIRVFARFCLETWQLYDKCLYYLSLIHTCEADAERRSKTVWTWVKQVKRALTQKYQKFLISCFTLCALLHTCIMIFVMWTSVALRASFMKQGEISPDLSEILLVRVG